MVPGADIDNLKRRIRALADTRAEVILVYLFGSYVTGELGPLSDIDLAVLLVQDAPVPRLRSQLLHAFSTALEGETVDLIILNEAPVELSYAVIAQGEALYQRERAARIEYEADVLSRYGDYLPFLRAQRQHILQGVGDERRIQRYREALGRTQRALGTSGAPPRQAPS